MTSSVANTQRLVKRQLDPPAVYLTDIVEGKVLVAGDDLLIVLFGWLVGFTHDGPLVVVGLKVNSHINVVKLYMMH